jgi:hypothetical protein
MEPFEKDELSEGELDRLLGEWNAPTVWRGAMPRVPQVIVKTERVEVPVVQERVITKYVYKKEKAAISFDIQGLKPVAELRPRIIRSADAKN